MMWVLILVFVVLPGLVVFWHLVDWLIDELSKGP